MIYKMASKTYNKPDKKIYYPYKYPFLDIFIYKNVDDKLYTRDSSKWYSKKCFYFSENVNKILKIKFVGFHINVMPDHERYFNSCYGSDWNDYGLYYLGP